MMAQSGSGGGGDSLFKSLMNAAGLTTADTMSSGLMKKAMLAYSSSLFNTTLGMGASTEPRFPAP